MAGGGAGGGCSEKTHVVAADTIQVTDGIIIVAGDTNFAGWDIVGDGVVATGFVMTGTQGGGFVCCDLAIDRCHDTTGMASLAIDRCVTGPDRLTIITSVHVIDGAVAGITDCYLIVGNKVGHAVNMIRARSIIGVAGHTSELDPAGAGINMLVMCPGEIMTAAGGDAADAVLVTGTTSPGGRDIPVGIRFIVATNRTGSGGGVIGAASSKTGEFHFNNTVNMFNVFSAGDQSSCAGGRVGMTKGATVALIEVLDMAGGVIALSGAHGGCVITVTGITGGDAAQCITPGRSSQLVSAGAVSGALATVGMTGTGTGTVTALVVGRGHAATSRLDGILEGCTGEDILEGALIVCRGKVGIMTKNTGKSIAAGAAAVSRMRGAGFGFVVGVQRVVVGRTDGITGHRDVGGRRIAMAAVATGPLKAAQCADGIMRMTGTTVFALDVGSGTAGHGGQVAMALFAVTRSCSGIAVCPDGLCGTES